MPNSERYRTIAQNAVLVLEETANLLKQAEAKATLLEKEISNLKKRSKLDYYASLDNIVLDKVASAQDISTVLAKVARLGLMDSTDIEKTANYISDNPAAMLRIMDDVVSRYTLPVSEGQGVTSIYKEASTADALWRKVIQENSSNNYLL